MAKKLEGYSLLFLETAIIFLNTLAIIVISRFKTKYNPDILIFTLAVADLLKAIIPLNMTLVAYLGDKAMVEGEPSCYIFGWTAFTLNSGIMLVMTVMAIDRYIAICWPFEYKHFLSKKRLVYTIIAVFLFSGTHSALPLVRVGRMRSYYNGSFCHFDFDSTIPANLGYNIFVLVLGTSMLMVVIFCYTRAMFSVRGLIKRQRRMSTSTRDIDGADKKRQSTNHMFARLMIVMMMAFCLSWLLFLVVVLQHVSGWFEIAPEAHFWSMRLAVVNSVFNPLIGAAMCKPYRRGYLYILCKFLHCCGFCSSYKADDPWTRSRKPSLSSRNSCEREPQTPTTNETALGVKSNPSFSYQDSGIVPDCQGSIGYHQGGVINAAYEMDISRTCGGGGSGGGDGRIKERPRLHRKRISFKDEVEATQAGLTLEGTEKSAGAMGGTPDEAISPQRHSMESLTQSSKPSTNQLQGGSCFQESDHGNSIVVISQVNQSTGMERRSHSNERSRKCGVSGVSNLCASKPQESSSPVSTPENIDFPLNAQDDPSLKDDNTVKEKNTLIDNCQLPLEDQDATSEEAFPKDPRETKEFKYSEQGTVIADINVECQSTPVKDHRHDQPIQESALLQTVQITHFPVSTNSNMETATVCPALSSNFQRSQSFHSFSPLPLRSQSLLKGTDIISFPRVKPRSQSFANGSQVTERNVITNNKTQNSQYSILPEIPRQAFGTRPFCKTERSKSSFSRTKSFESALRKKPHSMSVSTTYRALNLPPFERRSTVVKGEQLKGIVAIPSYSESDFTRSLPETVLNSPHETTHTGHFRTSAAAVQHDSLANVGRHKENEDSPQRQACDPQITRPSSKIYKELSELSEKELEREVFC